MGISSLEKNWLLRDHIFGTVFCGRKGHCHKYLAWLGSGIGVMIGLFLLVVFLTAPDWFLKSAWAQKEVTSKPYRYSEREVSSRYYETYEAKPRPYPVFVRGGIPQREAITLSPIAEKVRRRQYLADSHWGLKFYERLTCISCHPRQARNLHKRRAKITCRQCHGPEPIAGLKHYYSKMNPRRRHAFICAKCHEGANVSFATYVVHEPNPTNMSTRKEFPLLFYVFWMMAAIAVGTFAAFLPHTFMWGLREFLPDTFMSGLKKRLVKRRNPDGQN
ncbi:MAG: hypothetical protein GY850_30520 [bacterium]|nr:hypothetical protein [bacterium]